MILGALLTLWLESRGLVKPASFVLITLIWIGITLLVLGRPGLDSAAWWLYIAPVYLAGMLFGPRFGILVLALSVVVGGALAYSFEAGLIEPLVGETRTLGRWLSGTLFIMAMLGLVSISRKQLLKALYAAEESESRFRDLVENSQGIVCVHDLNGRFVSVNPAAAQSLGYEKSEAEKLSLTDFVSRAAQPLIQRYLDRIKLRGASDGILHVRTKSGEERVWAYQNVLREADGEEPLVLAHALDVTDRNRVEQLNRLQRDLALELSAVVGTETTSRLCLEAAIEVSGMECGGVYVVDESSGALDLVSHKGLSDTFVNAVSRYEADTERAQMVNAGKPMYAQYQTIAPEGTEPGVGEGLSTIAIVPVLSGTRVVGSLNLASREMEEIPPFARRGLESIAAQMGTAILRAKTEEALRESEQRFRSLFDNAPDAMILADPQTGTVVDANAAATTLLSRPRKEIVGLHQTELHPEWMADQMQEAFAEHAREALALGRSEAMETLVVRSDGVEVPVEVVSTLVRLSGKSTQQGTYRDLTERKQAESERTRLEMQLRKAQKMEALGTLAGGVAHDFNNILLAIFGYGELAKHDLPEDSEARESVDNVLLAAERAARLVNQILTYSRQHEPERELTRVQSVAEESLSLLRATIPSTIEIRERLNPDASPVMADPAQIQQILMNLCTNAAHAMGESGGVLEVSVKEILLDKETAANLGNLQNERHILVTVKDTGHGMDAATAERVFDPFFTTKGPGRGTGLGLSVVHGIVLGHGGAIRVESEMGAGSTFFVYLPCAIEKPDTRTRRDSPAPALGGSERILFVDDEPAIVEMGAEHLKRLGYQVTSTTSSEDAIAIFKTRPTDFDAIVTDQTMPGRTGLQLAGDIRRIRPEMPIVLITGFSESVTPESLKEGGVRSMVMKPFASRALANAVREALDGPKP